MKNLGISFAPLLLSMLPACASTTQSPSGTTGTASGTSTGASGTASGASGTTGTSGTGATGAGSSGTSGAAGASGTASGASGTTGASGAAKDGGGSGATDGGSTTQGCADLPLCDGFETEQPNAPPSPALWSIITGCGTNDPSSTVTIDSTIAHTGTQSVKVVADGSSTCGPIFYNSSIVPSLGPSLYGRFFVRFSVPQPMSHSAFMSLGFTPDGGETTNFNFDNMEMTAQYGVFVWNSSDKTLPNIAPSATAPADTWLCVEFHTNAANGDLDTWMTLDGGAQGDPVSTMTFDPDATPIQNGVNDSWANSRTTVLPNPFQFTNISFGWVTFGGGPATVWFDDVALATTRIGCH